jgi:hypothetical protein
VIQCNQDKEKEKSKWINEQTRRQARNFSSISSSNAEATRWILKRVKALTRETRSTKAKGGIKIPLFFIAGATERVEAPRIIIPHPPRSCQEKNAGNFKQIHLPKIIQNDERKSLDFWNGWVYNTIKGDDLNVNAETDYGNVCSRHRVRRYWSWCLA